jgi:hypothetical protein
MQTTTNREYSTFQNTIDEITATTAYLELCLRTVTEPNLLEVFLRFICVGEFDGQRILDTLVSRITCSKKVRSFFCFITTNFMRHQSTVVPMHSARERKSVRVNAQASFVDNDWSVCLHFQKNHVICVMS